MVAQQTERQVLEAHPVMATQGARALLNGLQVVVLALLEMAWPDILIPLILEIPKQVMEALVPQQQFAVLQSNLLAVVVVVFKAQPQQEMDWASMAAEKDVTLWDTQAILITWRNQALHGVVEAVAALAEEAAEWLEMVRTVWL